MPYPATQSLVNNSTCYTMYMVQALVHINKDYILKCSLTNLSILFVWFWGKYTQQKYSSLILWFSHHYTVHPNHIKCGDTLINSNVIHII